MFASNFDGEGGRMINDLVNIKSFFGINADADDYDADDYDDDDNDDDDDDDDDNYI